MCRFLETIRVEDGAADLLPWHEQRFRATQMEAWGRIVHLPLAQVMPEYPSAPGVFKMRLLYSESGLEWSIEPYRRREIFSLELVDGSGIDYHLKSADRSELNRLSRDWTRGVEILILQEGRITDTGFSNVAFENNEVWWTPRRPLLKGTRRASLLESGALSEAEISIEDLRDYRRVALFNAMLPWEKKIILPIEAISKKI